MKDEHMDRVDEIERKTKDGFWRDTDEDTHWLIAEVRRWQKLSVTMQRDADLGARIRYAVNLEEGWVMTTAPELVARLREIGNWATTGIQRDDFKPCREAADLIESQTKRGPVANGGAGDDLRY